MFRGPSQAVAVLILAGSEEACSMMMSFIVLAETKISPKVYAPRVLPTIQGCLEGLALRI
jgi:hypothetical protein